jgi:hypothetical protein
MSPGRKILSEINHLGRCEDGANPLSPTANLKLLTKVASNLERKGITNIDINKEDVPKVRKHFPLGSVQQQPDENFKSRKEKSLSLLCNRYCICISKFYLNIEQ